MLDGYYYCLNCHSEITPDYNEHCPFCGTTAVAVDGDYSNEEVETAFDLLNKQQQGLIIVPPCKIADTVYFIENGQMRCGELVQIQQHKEPEIIVKNAPVIDTYYVNSAVISFPIGCSELTPYTRDDFGKTVFLTKEEAENKIKELNEK